MFLFQDQDKKIFKGEKNDKKILNLIRIDDNIRIRKQNNTKHA